MGALPPETPLASIRSISRFAPRLKNLGLVTVRDVLFHFPARYEDYSEIYNIADLIPNQEATVQARVDEIEGRRAFRRNLYVVEALLSDDTGSIRAVWFNQPYIRNILGPGRVFNFSGKVTQSRTGEIHLSSPTYEAANSFGGTKHTARIVPIYPETRGLTSKGLRFMIKPILDEVRPLPDPIPADILGRHGLPDIMAALRGIHFPTTLEEASSAKRRFAFDDLFYLQLFNLDQKMALADQKAPAVALDLPFVKDLLGHLPFALTLSQKQALWEILKDLEAARPMNRLLQGDVGSGKTVIAAIAALSAAHAGHQAVLMAPTEILARQHYLTFRKFFPEHEGGVALMTASDRRLYFGHDLETAVTKEKAAAEALSGRAGIIIGTQALIQKGLAFKDLALVIVDEQHRFGVNQRAQLVRQEAGGKREEIPHFLSMSATPIPRTLSLTLFGDLDLSLISEMPKDRKPVATKAVGPAERSRTYAFIKDQAKAGRQVFVVCPRIEPKAEETPDDIQKLEMRSVKEEFEKLKTKIFPELRIGMLHGKLRAAEKEKVMRDFADGKTDVLVTTAVIEVGVDVPNATVMLIEGADRFGLAQLYQFRGRVGRGEHQSYCFLMTESDAKNLGGRIKAIVSAKNGFDLAERDLRMRGPGEFLGSAQTGMPDLAMKAIQNPDLVKEAREDAAAILKTDRELSRHPSLKKEMARFTDRVHAE
ncbi:ATP-dependent DNA helicase RecG [Patescibacteria group bacterium]|nr:ATP-dependent DNA helicase RecG [Patescibacteria group bacterium]